MSRSLVIARVGASSLHPRWTAPGTGRDWDLYLCPYEPLPPQDGVGCVVGEVIPGPKWTGLRRLLNAWDGWREYDHVWLPDDDILADRATIDRLFATGRGLGLDLYAPALHETSWYAHFSTMRNQSFHGRWVGFVEIMMPAFSRRALELLLPTLDETRTGWGWGLDSVWPKLLGYRNVGIVDAAPVVHTRPVGQMRDRALAERVLRESDELLARHRCEQRHTTFAAFGPDLRRLELTPEALFARLVDGYRYLIDRDPRVLCWLADYQRRLMPPAAYPIAGTPEVGPPLEPAAVG
jgi:hypothetical protein